MKKIFKMILLFITLFSVFITSFNAKDLINVIDVQKSNECKITMSNDDEYIKFVVEKNNNFNYLYFVSYKITKLSNKYDLNKLNVKLEESLDDKTFNTVVENVKVSRLNDEIPISEFNELKAKKVYFRVSIYNDKEIINPKSNDIDSILNVKAKLVRQYNYYKASRLFTAELTGYYRVELWGAKGNYYDGVNIDEDSTKPSELSGNGAYTAGTIYLNKGTNLYVFTGENQTQTDNYVSPTVNGGASGREIVGGNIHYGGAGGGATDIRYFDGGSVLALDDQRLSWDNNESLNSRIMVAGAGAGAYYAVDKSTPAKYVDYCTGRGGDGGGLIGYEGSNVGIDLYQSNPTLMEQKKLIVENPKGGSQTSAGEVATCPSNDVFCNFMLKNGASSSVKSMFGSKMSSGIKNKGGWPTGGGGYYGGSGAAYNEIMTITINKELYNSYFNIITFLNDTTYGEKYKEFFIEQFKKNASCQELSLESNCNIENKENALKNIISIIATGKDIDDNVISDSTNYKLIFNSLFNKYLSLKNNYLLYPKGLLQTHTSGAGGSSYISGHTGCVAVDDSGKPKDGCDNKHENMPKPTSLYDYYEEGVGHQGSGAARITLLQLEDEDNAVAESNWVKSTVEDSTQNIINPSTSDFRIIIYVVVGISFTLISFYLIKKKKVQ